jgi:hypothetical protein
MIGIERVHSGATQGCTENRDQIERDLIAENRWWTRLADEGFSHSNSHRQEATSMFQDIIVAEGHCCHTVLL